MNQGQGICLQDKENHILISVGTKKANLAEKFLNGKDLGKAIEAKVAKAMKPFNYKLLQTKETTIDKTQACGFAYEYDANQVHMLGESYVVKKGKYLYYLNLYARSQEAFTIWQGFLGKILFD
jgi:hypothetical protein